MEDASDDELDGICGWGATNLDDELAGHARLPPAIKRRSVLPTLQPRARRKPVVAAATAEIPAVHASASPRPGPKTTATSEELAAAGRLRRQQLEAVAAAHAARQAAVVAIVSTSLELDEPEIRAPAKVRPARAVEPHVEPVDPLDVVDAVATTSTLLSLPLLSIVPGCGGSAARLSEKYPLVGYGQRECRPRKRKPRRASLPVSSTLLPPSPATTKSVVGPASVGGATASSAFTVAVRVPPAPRRLDVATDNLLPLIHPPAVDRTAPRSLATVAAAAAPDGREEREPGQITDTDDEDESWIRSYDDPDVVASSMAGLIQVLSTFATAGKARNAKKRRGKPKRTPHRRHKLDLEVEGQV